jgi:hypothetical protein
MDKAGRPVDKSGHLVDKSGNLVDKSGNLVDNVRPSRGLHGPPRERTVPRLVAITNHSKAA